MGPGAAARLPLDRDHRDGHAVLPGRSRRAYAGAVEHAARNCLRQFGRPRAPVFGLWPVRLADELRAAMIEEGIRKVDVWTARHGLVEVPFATDPIDPFFNTNRPEDLARGRAPAPRDLRLSHGGGSAALGAAWTVPVPFLLDLAKSLP